MNVNAKTPHRVGFLVLILVIASLGRSSLAQESQPPSQGVVLTGEDAVVLASEFFYNPEPVAKEIWQPSASDIARLEKLLPDFMRSQKVLPDDYQPLNEYFRQYVGVVRNGKKVICINFVHSSVIKIMARFESHNGRADFQKRPIVVDDGGADFFHIQFDHATGSFSGLRFNGYA